MTALHELQNALYKREEEWGKGKDADITFAATEMAGEVGEALEKAVDLIMLAVAAGKACNTLKKLARERYGMAGSRATKQELRDELGDVVICAARIANKESIHLGNAVCAKFNATSEKMNLKTRMP